MLHNIIVPAVFILSSTLAEEGERCMYGAVGAAVELPLNFDGLDSSSELTWIHNQKKVFRRRDGKVTVSTLKTKPNGALVLEKVQFSSAGDYRATVFSTDGVQQHHTTVRLCVLKPLSEPSLTATCGTSVVTLTCGAERYPDASVSWSKGGIPWMNATNHTLTLDLPLIGVGENVSCTVSNKVSKKTSKDVQLLCPDTGDSVSHPPTLGNSGINPSDQSRNGGGGKDGEQATYPTGVFWAVVAAGGGVFVLTVIGICVCVCCVRTRRRRRSGGEI
ncbi:hepatic and glial cell adhesion molecule isoform X2 [Brachyhypopomus gauderio]|uniref:hepatic and glial cell adhesion molecule isoform X2 n=1 Tax=Brachyhypopomus gauderio TaxID=698409 RepID=UPI0040428964